MTSAPLGAVRDRAEQVKDDAHFPNAVPRPEHELEALKRAWEPPKGWRIFSAVNNTFIGLLYVATALLFFVLAGILALIMRTQLAVPENNLVGHALYNQLFTMHGTIMMFLFAVPVVEAISVILLPNMQAARDLPFPRLSAYAFWAYLVGGLAFFCSIFFGLAPDGGWFMYPPLTSFQYSPGINADFWLLGIGFIEISAIAGAIEIIVGVLKTRAPGQSLDKLPVYSWVMLVFALMIVFAFPAVILATLLLELERAFHWPFFIAEKGGDPLLWQHLFWFFGHPEVYIIFLPAAGMVSMIVPAMAGTPLVGYRLVVLAVIATGFLSFGLWVHHMFATGLPQLSMSFFSAASMAVSIPTGIQVFAWIGTIASGKLQWNTPTYFVLGFLFIFVLGGLTGVMVAMMPFDWQAHDTYFIVAHLHYVLIGGMVFPLFAAIYYWTPIFSTRPLSEHAGKWAFWLIFLGVNITFFTMHITGLMGMPRRTYTYLTIMGWGTLNMISTLGAYMIAAGVLVFFVDLARNFRFTFDDTAGNIWNAGTLEWLPTGTYQTRSIPIVTSREPLWDQAEPRRGRGSGTLLPARRTDQRPRDHRYQSHRCSSAIPVAGDRTKLGAVARGGIHGGVLSAADRQARDSRRHLRSHRGGHGDLVDVEHRSGTIAPASRHRRRDHAAGLCRRTGKPFLVGDDRADPGRRNHLHLPGLFLLLSLDGQSRRVAAGGRRAPLAHLAGDGNRALCGRQRTDHSRRLGARGHAGDKLMADAAVAAPGRAADDRRLRRSTVRTVAERGCVRMSTATARWFIRSSRCKAFS